MNVRINPTHFQRPSNAAIIQIARPSDKPKIKSWMSASPEVCTINTHINHKAVAIIGNAKNCFNVSIQGPGFGRELIHCGLIARIR